MVGNAAERERDVVAVVAVGWRKREIVEDGGQSRARRVGVAAIYSRDVSHHRRQRELRIEVLVEAGIGRGAHVREGVLDVDVQAALASASRATARGVIAVEENEQRGRSCLTERRSHQESTRAA